MPARRMQRAAQQLTAAGCDLGKARDPGSWINQLYALVFGEPITHLTLKLRLSDKNLARMLLT